MSSWMRLSSCRARVSTGPPRQVEGLASDRGRTLALVRVGVRMGEAGHGVGRHVSRRGSPQVPLQDLDRVGGMMKLDEAPGGQRVGSPAG